MTNAEAGKAYQLEPSPYRKDWYEAAQQSGRSFVEKLTDKYLNGRVVQGIIQDFIESLPDELEQESRDFLHEMAAGAQDRLVELNGPNVLAGKTDFRLSSPRARFLVPNE